MLRLTTLSAAIVGLVRTDKQMFVGLTNQQLEAHGFAGGKAVWNVALPSSIVTLSLMDYRQKGVGFS